MAVVQPLSVEYEVRSTLPATLACLRAEAEVYDLLGSAERPSR